jgi:hypothetical protein
MKVIELPKDEPENLEALLEETKPLAKDAEWMIILVDSPDGPLLKMSANMSFNDVIAQLFACAMGIVMID